MVTRHVYSGIETIEEYISCGAPEDPNWVLAREFVWGGSYPEPVALIDHTAAGDKVTGVEEVLHYVRDELGNVVGLTDAGDPNASPNPVPAKLVERYDYDPYGRTYIEDPNTGTRYAASRYGNPLAWTSQRYDAGVRMYGFFARTYSPELGRWLQRDPLGHIDGANLYVYASDNPVAWTDPLGLTVIWKEGKNGSPERTQREKEIWKAAESRRDENGNPTAGGENMKDLENRKDVTVTVEVGDEGDNTGYEGQGDLDSEIGAENREKVRRGEPMDTTIHVNPDAPPVTYEDGTKSDPEADIVHETWHAHDYAEGNYGYPDNVDKKRDEHPAVKNEVRAAQVENENRDLRKLPKRKEIVDLKIPPGLPGDARALKKKGCPSSQPDKPAGSPDPQAPGDKKKE